MTIDMNLNATQQIAEDSRTVLRQRRSASGVMADNPKPVVVGVADGDVVPVGILKSPAAQRGTTTVARLPDLPITITVSNWPVAAVEDEVVIFGYAFKDGVDDPDDPESWAWEEWHRERAPAIPRPDTWPVTLPAGKLRDLSAVGTVSPTLWKIESRGDFKGNFQYSEMATVYVDAYAPFHNKGDTRVPAPTRVDFPLAVGAKIDSAYLGTIATSGMEFTLPVSSTAWDYKATDKAFIYLNPTSIEPTLNLTPTLTVDPVPADGKVSIPASVIGQLPNGTVWLIMAYEDEAGNRSADMLANSRMVEYVPLPVPRPPIVEAANTAGDNVIDLADVRFYRPGGVPIKVMRPANTNDTDRATVFFENFESLELTPPVQTFGTETQLTFEISWEDLKLIYTTLAGSDPDAREVSAPVLWTLIRGVSPIDSPPATPDLDFSYPGEENPDEPDLINQSLAKVQVRGVDNILNTLTPPDLVTDPKVIIPLPTGAGALGNDVVCSWFYNGELVTQFQPAGLAQYENTLPAGKVAAGGSGNKLTYWSFSYIGGLNPQNSLDETVVVTTVAKQVPPPVIDKLYALTMINCSTVGFGRGTKPPFPTLTFNVKANSVLAGLQSITAHWVGTTDAQGNVPISGTEQNVSIPVTGNEATAGIAGSIGEYLTKMVPIQTRPDPDPAPKPPITYARLSYTAVWADGRATSDPAIYEVALINGNREFCHEVR